MASETPREVIKRFFATTTCHGLQQVNIDKKIQAVLWGALSLVLGVLCCTYLVMLVQQVREYKVQLVPSISDEPVPFPAVTVCNINPFMQSKLSAIPELAAIEKFTRAKMGHYDGNKTTSVSGAACLDWAGTKYPREANGTCANPNGAASGPWCFVADGRSEPCYDKYP